MIEQDDRLLGVDLAKLIACFMVVVLHVFGAGGGIYLIGSYGIPLFFMANGFFMYDRELSWKYYARKLKKYLAFYLKWTILFIPLESYENGGLTNVPFQAFFGRSSLFHLWFLPAICIGLFMFCAFNEFGNGQRFQTRVTLNGGTLVASAMCLIYLYFLFGSIEIKNFVAPPLRIVTTCGYMYFGMIMRKLFEKAKEKPDVVQHRKIGLYSLIITSYLWIGYTSIKTNMIWASSHYNSPMVIVGCIAIFAVCMTVKHTPKIVGYLIKSTTGIWILHPFIIRVLNKVYYVAGISISFYTKCLNLILCVVLCTIITTILNRNKILKQFVTV